MKAVILAGGLGTRMREETCDKPKPMITIGEKPILWHIMKIFSSYDIHDFVICCGYKGDVIKDYFLNNSNFVEKIEDNQEYCEIKVKESEAIWKIILVDTGENTMTGGRLKRVKKHLNETFCFTYGDTLNDLNVSELIEFHKQMKKLATVTACQPPGKFGILKLNENVVSEFEEKPLGDGSWVNGGFFVLEPEVIDFISDDSTVWEKEPMQQVVKEKQLSAYKHSGFYQPMDTIYEKNILDDMWEKNDAKWKVWK